MSDPNKDTAGWIFALVIIALIIFLIGMMVGTGIGEQNIKYSAVDNGAAHWGDEDGIPKLVWHCSTNYLTHTE